MQYGFLGFLLGMDSSVQRPWDLCTWSKSNLVIEFHPYPIPWHCYDTSISDEVSVIQNIANQLASSAACEPEKPSAEYLPRENFTKVDSVY